MDGGCGVAPGLSEPRQAAGGATPAGKGRDRFSSVDAIALATGVIATILLLAALREGRVIAIPTVLAGLAAVSLAPPARALEGLGASRGAAAAAVVFGAVAAVGALIFLLFPSLDGFGERLPALARRIGAALRRFEEDVGAIAATPDAASDAGAGGEPLVASGRRAVIDWLLAAPAFAGALLYGVFLAYFLLAERARVARSVLWLAKGASTRRALHRAMREVRLQVGGYLLTLTVINCALAVAAGTVFWLLGLADPAVWGALFGLLNFMPYIGPAIVAVGVFGAGLAQHGAFAAAVPPVIAVVALNVVEGSFLTPAVVARRVEVSALAVFVAIAFGAWLWGAAGAVIATPALIVLRTFGLRLAPALRRAGRAPGRAGASARRPAL